MPLDPLGAAALTLARGAIAHALGVAGVPPPEPLDELDRPAATFVTLTCAGALRGCVGSLSVRRSLREDLIHNAKAAAFEDPRFPRLTADEYARLAVEVSLLSVMEPLAASSHAAACAALRPGIDGVLIECDGRRATFLPQVWEDARDAREFLDLLLHKAGLAEGQWPDGMRLSRYTVRKWREPDAAPRTRRAGARA